MTEEAVTERSGSAGWSWRAEWPHWLLIASMFALSAWAWGRVGGPVPVHWGIDGRPDGYAGRTVGLLMAPGLAVGLYLLLLLIPRIDPARANYASFVGPYRVIRLTLTVLLAAVHGLAVSAALDGPLESGRWVPVGVGALLVVLGNVMGKVRPNYFVGVRTPWTLASARSWEQTNRLGGKLFVVAGVALAVAGYVGEPRLLTALAVAGGVALAWLAYFSYRVWRDDPERVPASGTRPAAGQ